MTVLLEFFAVDEAVSELRAQLDVQTGFERLSLLSALAWQMRQRDTPRALKLADEVEAGLDDSAFTLAEQACLKARLQLIRGEAKWLLGELDASTALAQSALHSFDALSDARDCVQVAELGIADAHWLLAGIAVDQGDGPRQAAELEAMAAAASGIDPVRATVAQAALARAAAFRDVAQAKEQWGTHPPFLSADLHPAAASAIEDFWSIVAAQSGDFVQSIRHRSAIYTLSLASGEARRAMIAAANIGDMFNSLNDYHGALDWMQRGLDLARLSGWPGMLGNALMQTANTLRGLQRYEVASILLREALILLAPLTSSRYYAIALKYQGDVEFDRQHYASALESFRLLEQRAVALTQSDLLCEAWCGQANALLKLGQPGSALKAAQAALEATNSNAEQRITALRVMADIYSHSALAPPPGMSGVSAPLHYLQQAADLAVKIEGYTTPSHLLEELAQAHADVGAHSKAFELAKQAISVRKKTLSQEAGNRATAIQISQETERARAEGEHQRHLAMVQAERADALELANATLEQLGAVGRDITANLDTTGIFTALDRHVHTLLDATAFLIYRLEVDGQSLKMVFGMEAGNPLPAHLTRLDDPERKAARCARERTEIITAIAPGQGNTIAGTLETLSLMFAPLLIGDRLLGVMTIQSSKPNAYAEREVAIFRALCAYGAIALANAEAQAQLLEKNSQLERLAVSDRLTGLYNRLRLDQVLEQELSRKHRSAAHLSVILLDIDQFKSVNDTYGHQVGDQVLITVARLIREGSREVDVVGRWGGEEFLIVCPETTLMGAAVLAEKLRTLLANHTFEVINHRTSSFGVASLGDKETIDALIARADAALYRAKKSGRNKVEVDTLGEVHPISRTLSR